ncbi:trichohyalin [Exaiptasia diaphana]|uniref:Uncharacterized protein n=1 Tax=Exaiptasia diaphana TaxID=2652724 RepID=A0A913WWN1_EXADI|nr:trichohyalin [Exaiptasia diaphana]
MANQTSQAMKWTEEHNIVFVREIIAHSPWDHKRGSTERGERWNRISATLNSLPNPKFKVSQRSVRDRYVLLEKKHKQKVRKEDGESGTNPEESELDQAMADIISQMEESDREFEKASTEKKKKIEDDAEKGEEMRRQSLETFKESQKRNAECDNPEKPAKRRRTGSDTVGYLREKCEIEQKFKEEELELKRKEMENQHQLHLKEIRLKMKEQEDKRKKDESVREQMSMQQQQLQILMQQQQQTNLMTD